MLFLSFSQASLQQTGALLQLFVQGHFLYTAVIRGAKPFGKKPHYFIHTGTCSTYF
jgi:hypothetical protein